MILIAPFYFSPKLYGGLVTAIRNFENLFNRESYEIFTSDCGYESQNSFVGTKSFKNHQHQEVTVFKGGVISYFFLIWKLYVKRDRVMFIHGIYSIKFNLIPAIIGNKIAISPHGMLQKGAMEKSLLKKRFFLYLLRLILILKRDVTWLATDGVEKEDISRFFPNSKKIVVCANLIGFDGVMNFTNSLDSDKIKLLYYSSINSKKNLLFLLKVISKLPTPVELDIFGAVIDVDYYQRCVDFIKRNGLAHSVKFYSPISIEKFKKTTGEYDYFVLPTKGENFGYAILESMACGLPVIISDQTPWNLNKLKYSFSLSLEDGLWIDLFKKLKLTKSMYVAYRRKEIYDYFMEIKINNNLSAQETLKKVLF